MKIKTLLVATVTLWLPVTLPVAAAPLATAFTYQGKLNDGPIPASGSYDFRFTLFDAVEDGSPVGNPATVEDLAVLNGVFSTPLDFGAVFDGSSRWLEIAVRPGASVGDFMILKPRPPLTAAPYALYALTPAGPAGPKGDAGASGAKGDAGDVGATGAQGIAGPQGIKGDTGLTGPQGLTGAAGAEGPKGDKGDVGATGPQGPKGDTGSAGAQGSPGVAGIAGPKGDKGDTGLTGPAGAQGATGPQGSVGLTGATGPQGPQGPQGVPGSADGWSRTGNAGTAAGVNFFGTTDNQALEFKVNNARALRLEPTGKTPNLLGGSSGNRTLAGVVGAVITGGGDGLFDNVVTDDYGTIAGGANNLAGDFAGTTGDAIYATVGGGYGNSSRGYATVGGGYANNGLGSYATVSGGTGNNAISNFATVGGGNVNTASGYAATVGGGEGNTASGSPATVGGGRGNQSIGEAATVGGGEQNTSSDEWATVGGGHFNTSSSYGATVGGGQGNSGESPWSTVGGGFSNTSARDSATVGGGYQNTSSGDSATVGGGYRNTGSGTNATVPGGSDNTASGAGSFAAGRNAKATDDGSFVWGDGTVTAASGGPNRFDVLATGGVSFYTGVNRVSLGSSAGLEFGAQTRQMINLYGAGFGIGVQASTLYYRSDLQFVWYQGGVHADGSGDGGGGARLMYLHPTAGLVLEHGTYQNPCDRNIKTNFIAADARQLLAKVISLPISTWSYTNDLGTCHLGPMAQDFHTAFNIGNDDKHISTVDEGGVALAAIQGLDQKVESENAALRADLVARDQRIAALERSLAELKSLVSGLAPADRRLGQVAE